MLLLHQSEKCLSYKSCYRQLAIAITNIESNTVRIYVVMILVMPWHVEPYLEYTRALLAIQSYLLFVKEGIRVPVNCVQFRRTPFYI